MHQAHSFKAEKGLHAICSEVKLLVQYIAQSHEKNKIMHVSYHFGLKNSRLTSATRPHHWQIFHFHNKDGTVSMSSWKQDQDHLCRLENKLTRSDQLKLNTNTWLEMANSLVGGCGIIWINTSIRQIESLRHGWGSNKGEEYCIPVIDIQKKRRNVIVVGSNHKCTAQARNKASLSAC